MKTSAVLAIGISIGLASTAIADTAVKDKAVVAMPKTAKPIKPMKMTCAEFLSFDEVTRPQIVYWSEGFNRKGKAEDAVFDVERTNTLVPVLVEECTKEPQASYWTKVKNEFKKIF